YRRPELACVTCHAIGGAGGRVGPDMTSIGASAPADYLVESLFEPSAKIKEGYHSITVETRDGLEYSGTLARETPEELVLRNAANEEVTLAKNNLARREQSPLSLMPAGLLEPLPEQDQLDLVAFLTRLGKPGPFDASRGGVARSWRIAFTVHTDAQAGNELWPLTAPWTDRRWTATTSLVNGMLPRAVIEEATKAQFWTGKLGLYAATEVTLAQDRQVTFQLAGGPGAELWVGGKKAGGPGASTVELPAGTHRVLVRLDPARIPDTIKLESRDAVFGLN
ncbi:MAG TPA: sorbosone dehydrogenase, partial [Verrucomicrobiota bacterium]|nr:sorbosone dehydrogenase [Verrucomicrobiota bacterium]